MSIFVRPDSPPPRQPSPDILPAPLPYPHHPRRVASQPKIRVHSPTVPPGLHARTKTLQSARSVDFLGSDKRTKSSDDGHSLLSMRSPRQRTRSTLTVSLASTPCSSPSPSPSLSSRNSPDFTRTLSVAFPSPAMYSASPPQVPSVPYVYTGPKHIICPKPKSFSPVYLPDIEEMTADVYPPTSFEQKPTVKPVLPPLEKHRSMGMACLKFFRLRSQARQSQNPVTAM